MNVRDTIDQESGDDAALDKRAPDSTAPKPMAWLSERIWGFTSAVIWILIVTTMFGLFSRSHWLADMFANLRVQQVIGLLVAILVTAGFRYWRWLALLVVLLAIHVPWFLSAWTGASDSAGKPADLVVMVANVLTANRDHDSVVQQVNDSDADVVAILELGTPLHARLEKDLAATYPHRITNPQDSGNFGIGIYSRYPVSDTAKFALNIEAIKSIATTVTKNAKRYRVVATHPLPPMGKRGFHNRNDHLQQLSDRIAAYRQSNPTLPMVLVGDLNLTPWSPIFSDLESKTGLKRAGRGWGMTPTWYATTEDKKAFFPMGLILDHALISDDLQCLSRKVGQANGSDHRSVRVELATKPE